MGSVKSWIRGRLLGTGCCGKVNLAVNTDNGHLFAVKSIECSSELKAVDLEAIDNEVAILQSLDSPYVVSCLGSDWSVEKGTTMRNVFLEYMPGGSLVDLMDNLGGKLNDEGLIRGYTRSVLEGLNYLHSKGVVHCDIKGRNVLVGTSGAKIADFGAAKRMENVSMKCIKGTPLWMAPEVVRRVEQGTASDIWSLGCTVVEMATGKPPWSHLESHLSTIFRIGYTDQLPGMPATLSQEGLDFLSKCFQRDVTLRWTAAQLLTHPFIAGQSSGGTYCPVPATTTSSVSPKSVLDLPAEWDSYTEGDKVMMNSPSVPIYPSNCKQPHNCAIVTQDWWCTSPLMPKEGEWITVRSSKPSSAAAGMASPLCDLSEPATTTPNPTSGESKEQQSDAGVRAVAAAAGASSGIPLLRFLLSKLKETGFEPSDVGNGPCGRGPQRRQTLQSLLI